MTPPHGTNIDDSGERPAAGERYVTKDAMKLAVANHQAQCHEEGGALNELRKWVTKLALWQAAATGIALLLNGAGLVYLGWWLNNRLPPSQAKASTAPSLINSAHAETKGPAR